MKNILLITVFLFLFVSLKSQQQDLVNETWYLTKIIEDGVEYHTPEPWENFINARLKFLEDENQYHIIASICEHEVLMDVETLNEEEFTCEYIDDTMAECAPYIPYYQEYEHKYTNFWRSFPEGANNPFLYEITEENDVLALIVTNSLGNKTYYYNTELSLNDVGKNRIVFYPNPVHDKLFIKNQELKITSVKISDVTGKTIINETVSKKELEFDFSSFPPGVYFITFVEGDGKIFKTEKILKK